MQAEYTGFVDRGEWRWVTLVSVTFILVIFSPLIIIAWQTQNFPDLQFMGALHNHNNSAADLSRMQQGLEGQLLVYFRHTPEDHAASFSQPLYMLLGLLARVTNQTPFIIYHVVRIFASLFMFLTIYNLGANIWTRVRTRRIFFIFASVGAGFGWIVALSTGLYGGIIVPDMTLPQIYPLYASAANVHYPLAIACLAILASLLIPALRPGSERLSSVEDGGATMFMTSIVLAFIYPDALLPIGIAYIITTAIHWYAQRKISMHEWNWGLWLIVPALPIVVYNILIYLNNPVIESWVQQRGSQVPSPLMLVVGLGLPLIIALPGIWRAARRLEADGDRFMLLWLIAMIVTMYLPLQLNQALLVGLMLPVAYFATRSTEDFWLTLMKRRYWHWAYVLIIPLMTISPILWLFLPTAPSVFGWTSINRTSIERDYSDAFAWLKSDVAATSVVLAAPDPSLWLPAWSGMRVVYGHPTETVDSAEKRQEVVTWYNNTDSDSCDDLIDRYDIAYIFYGPRESELGLGECLDNYVLVLTFGNVNLYATQYAGILP